jgi:NADP-dependent 3-hydroxy acid dehydrogenase YdfG
VLAEGQRAIVTGASSGIGRAIALALSAKGLHVILVGRDVERLKIVAREAASPTTVMPADLTTETGCAAIAAMAQTPIDVVVHGAGTYFRSNVESMSFDQWLRLNILNLHRPIQLTAALLPALRATAGQIVFINSTAVQSASPGLAAYSSSKRALQAATDALRQEINDDGIRVLSVYPGRTDTPMQQAILAAEKRAAGPNTLMNPNDIATIVLASLSLPRSCEVTDITMRPGRKLG